MSGQLIVLILVFGLSALSWVFNELQKQRELKKAREAAKQRYEEQLRTGRIQQAAPAAKKPATPSLEELAARRQAQLRELRRRQQERARPGVKARQPTSRTGPTTRAPSRPSAKTPGPQTRQQTQPRPLQAQQSVSSAAPLQGQRPVSGAIPIKVRNAPPSRPSAPQARSPRATKPDPRSKGVHSGAKEWHTHHSLGDVSRAKTRPSSHANREALEILRSGASDPRRLRALIAAIEIIATPVSMREDGAHAI